MQAGTIDKAMYYDAQPNGHYCGLFYYPSERTTPVYEAFRAFNVLHALGTAVESAAPDRGLAVVAAKGGSDKAILLANVANDSVTLRPAVAGAEGTVFRLYRVDPQHRGLDEDGAWKPGEELTVPKDGFVLLSTRDAKVVQAQGNVLSHALNGIDTSDSTPEQTPPATGAKDGN